MSLFMEKLLEKGMDLAGDQIVTDLRVGLGYTAVEVSHKHVGLAYTFRRDIGEGCTPVGNAGEIAGRCVKEVFEWAGKGDLLANAIGLATLNALLQPRLPESLGEDFLAFMKIGGHDSVGMIGFFAPLVQQLRERCGELLIFEQEMQRAEGLLPPEEIGSQLPECSIVIISATTLVNQTFDKITKCTGRAREVVLLGLSTPLLPEVFEKTPLTYLAGIQMIDGGKTLRIVSEGGGTRRLSKLGTVRKVVVPVRRRK